MQDARWVNLRVGKEARRPVERATGWLLVALVAGATLSLRAVAADNEKLPTEKLPAETVVRIYPTALVSADQVTLADIAAIHGEGSELVAGWTMTSAPSAGRESVISLSHVQKVLASRGVNLGCWVFRGSTRCTVKRANTAPAATRRPHRVEAKSGRTRLDHVMIRDADNGDAFDVSEESHGSLPDIDPNTLSGAVHEYISRRLANIGGKPSIRFSPTMSDLLGLSRPTYDFKIMSRSDRLLGFVPLDITIYEKSQFKQTLSTLAEVSVHVPMVVAARAINRKQTIKAQDLVVVTHAINRLEELGLTDVAPILGQQAKNFVDKGQKLTLRDIEPVPLVSRNDLVTVWVHCGNLRIKGSAKALSGGGYGESVVLKNEASKQTFTATVTGCKIAEVNSPHSSGAIATAFERGKG